MPYSRKLSQRLATYIGLNERSAWGRRAADLGIQAAKGHAPIATTSLDFSETPVVNATAFAATPLNWTVTDINTATSPTIACTSGNGYVLINPGSKADSGYNLQANVADVVPGNLMQFITAPNTTIAAGRDIYWGIRMAISCATAWDGKFFVGLAITDTATMTGATGAFDGVADAIGFHMGESGVLRLVSASTVTGVTAATLTPTGTTLSLTSTNFTAASFHDFFFHAHYATAAGTTAASYAEAYIDGVYAGKVEGADVLPDLSGVSLYNTLEVLNGPANAMDMAVAEILNGITRVHIAS